MYLDKATNKKNLNWFKYSVKTILIRWIHNISEALNCVLNGHYIQIQAKGGTNMHTKNEQTHTNAVHSLWALSCEYTLCDWHALQYVMYASFVYFCPFTVCMFALCSITCRLIIVWRFAHWHSLAFHSFVWNLIFVIVSIEKIVESIW